MEEFIPLAVGIVVGMTFMFLVIRSSMRSSNRVAAPDHARPSADPQAVNTPPVSLLRAFEDSEIEVGGGERIPVSLHPIGELELPTGFVVACDPLVFPESDPFTRALPPGRYPVELAVVRFPSGDERVAFARLLIASEPPVAWELALTAGQEIATLREGEIFGYGVDAGLGCFMDATSVPLLLEAMDLLESGSGANYWDDLLKAEMSPNHRDTWDWVLHRPDRSRPENVAIFHSGWGDGIYPSFWGLDAEGAPVCLITDFWIGS
jgi:hypothetical protein